jgi:hypothetical protein
MFRCDTRARAGAGFRKEGTTRRVLLGSKPPDRAKGPRLADSARQPLPLRGVVSQELEMPIDHPSLAFFALIAASLCAAVALIGLLIAGDVAGPRVAMNNLPPHSQAGHRQ